MDRDWLQELHPVRPRQHHVYDDQVNGPVLDGLFQRLAEPNRLPRDFLTEVSQKTRIPVPTLKQWRANLKKDPSWRPRHGRPGPRLLTREDEEQLARRVHDKFINQARYLSGEQLRSMGLEMWRERHRDEDRPAEPSFSNRWKASFEHDHGLSERTPHARRRTDPRDDIIAIFLQDIELAHRQFPPRLILNADETCWRVLNGKLKTIAPTGADEVQVLIGFDSKQSVTVMACCSADGRKLPLYAIVKGKTAKCEEAIRNDRRLRRYINKTLYLGHTERGWANNEFQLEYLKFIEEQVDGRYCSLVWDVHSSHRSADVVACARQRKINLLFVPAGQTGEYQPLDRRVFGVLKKQAHRLFLDQLRGRDLTVIDRIDALAILCQAWERIEAEVIRRAWSCLLDDSIIEVEEEELENSD